MDGSPDNSSQDGNKKFAIYTLSSDDGDKVASVRRSLRDMALGEIYRCLLLDQQTVKIQPDTPIPDGAAKVAAFVMSCVLLETLGGFCFRVGKQPAFEQMCSHYLEKINPKYKNLDLYGALRSGLVHHYSPVKNEKGEEKRFCLKDGRPEEHLTLVSDKPKTYVLNLQNFVADVERVLDTFTAKVETNEDKCKDNLIAWAGLKGWMAVIELAGGGGLPGELQTTVGLVSGVDFGTSQSLLGEVK